MDIQAQAIDQNFIDQIFFLGVTLLIVFILLFILAVASYFFVMWVRKGRREKKSLEFDLLLVKVPKDNEGKIDAMEQFFSAISSIGHGGHGILSFLKMEFLNIPDHVSFEIVGSPGDIRF